VGSPASGVFQAIYSVFDLNVQVESTAWDTVITGKGKTKHPSAPCSPWFAIPEYPSATIEFSRSSRDAGKFSDHSVVETHG
jgi:hypothetical protein